MTPGEASMGTMAAVAIVTTERAVKKDEDGKRRAFFDDLEVFLQDDSSFRPLK